MTDASVLRRCVRSAVIVPVVAFGIVGCGSSDQSSGVVVPPAPTIESANKNMEDFMKGQTKGSQPTKEETPKK